MTYVKPIYMNRTLLSLIVALLAAFSASGQNDSRDYIRNAILIWGECRNVAITRINGDVAIYGNAGSGYSCSGVPEELRSALSKLHNENQFIDDVQLTDNGNWLVLYGLNSMIWSGVPEDMENALYEVRDDGETVTSVTFNDDGDWIVISDEYIRASNAELRQWIVDGTENMGRVLTACLTDDAVMIVYEDGFRYDGNVPPDLLEAMRNTDIHIFRIKVSAQSWFFADISGKHFGHNTIDIVLYGALAKFLTCKTTAAETNVCIFK